MESTVPSQVITTDNLLDLYTSRDLGSAVVPSLPKGTDIQLGPPELFEGREWLQATLKNGSTGYLLGPSVRGHTKLCSTGAAIETQDVPDPANTSRVGEESPTPAKKVWICPKCDIEIALPLGQKKCPSGHRVEEPMSFSVGLYAGLAFGIGIAILNQLPSGIWRVLGSLPFWFLMFCVSCGPFFFLVRAILASRKRGPARRLASSFYGLSLGTTIALMVVLYATAKGWHPTMP